VTKTYDASTTAKVISTAGDAVLSVSDPSANAPGHLVNGTFALPQALQARALNARNTSTAFNFLSANPLNLLAYDGPISNDDVTLQFRQAIASSDPLRTGTYSKTRTFTLSTTNPETTRVRGPRLHRRGPRMQMPNGGCASPRIQ
jgi:hypothetical protein